MRPAPVICRERVAKALRPVARGGAVMVRPPPNRRAPRPSGVPRRSRRWCWHHRPPGVRGQNGSVDASGTGARVGRWVTRRVRSVLGGLAAIGLAFTNLPVLAVALIALALAPVPYLGLALVPWGMTLVRRRADLERRLASRTGILITRPYHPPPEHDTPGSWPHFRWIVTDQATWRDLAWLVPGAIVGFGLGAICVAVPLYGLAGLTLTPLWIWLGTGWYGYGVHWSVDSFADGLLCVPQGAAILAAGLWLAPWLRRGGPPLPPPLPPPPKAAPPPPRGPPPALAPAG